MDEYSDFQMAIPSAPSKNKNIAGGRDFWGNNLPKPHSASSNLNGGPLPKEYFQHGLVGSVNIIPPPTTSNEEYSVGSRLANYKLNLKTKGSLKQDADCLKPVGNQLTASHSKGSTKNQLLIGEEDKYAALRALVDFSDDQPSVSLDTLAMEESKSKMPFETVLQNNREDDFSDFGDFQSFSNTVTSPQTQTQPMAFTAQTGNKTGLSEIGVNQVPQYDFGDFISVPSILSPSLDPCPTLKNTNFTESKYMCNSGTTGTSFETLAQDLGNFSTLISSHISPSFKKKPLEEIPTAELHSFDPDTFESSQFDQLDLTHSLEQKDSIDDFSSSHSTLNSPLSNYMAQDDVAIPCFIKTSLIGCDARSCSDIESLRSASILETNIEDIEYIPSNDKNKVDISPETRSIASLDLGTYCTYDVIESKISSSDNNNKQGFRGFSLNSLPNSHQAEIRDLYNTELVPTDETSTDKYQCFRDDLQVETNAHILNWSKCLHNIREIFAAVAAIFRDALSSEIIEEVVLHEKGESFIKGLVEICHVFNRVRYSHKHLGSSGEIDALCLEIHTLWEALTSYFVGTYAAEIMACAETSHKCSLSEKRSCRICLNHIEENDELNYMEHEKVLYHFGCANLWINNVEPNLPWEEL